MQQPPEFEGLQVKVLTVIGARPQFIKAAPVSAAIASTPRAEEVLVHTGQHYDHAMSDVFFAELGIREPNHHLGIGGGTHGQNTGRMIEALERAMIAEKPDWVLVYGDTDSTLAGAIAAAKLHIAIAHVEAGLRSYNMRMPEEVNRRLVDHCSSLLLTPTETADANLASEGIDAGRIENVGDVMYDACLLFSNSDDSEESLRRLNLFPRDYVLATVHRQENTDVKERLSAILGAFGRVEGAVVLPLHPRTRQRIADFGCSLPGNVRILEPQGYRVMNVLERNARLIATDSGGVQKEAYFHRVPCVTLRGETEWTELIELGWNRLAPPDSPDLGDILAQRPVPGRDDRSPYGDGTAAKRIAEALVHHSR